MVWEVPKTAGMAPALTIGDPLCVVEPALRDPDCPNAMPRDCCYDGTSGWKWYEPYARGCSHGTSDEYASDDWLVCLRRLVVCLRRLVVMPPMTGGTGAGDGGVALTIGDPRCIVGAAMRDPRCPNANMP